MTSIKHIFHRLRLLWKLIQVSDRAREIELEWQRIQQDEHDFKFAFETHMNEETQGNYLYKKGLADGIKWSISRFS